MAAKIVGLILKPEEVEAAPKQEKVEAAEAAPAKTAKKGRPASKEK